MKRLSFLVIAAVLALTGCTYTRMVDPLAYGPFSTINRLGARKAATVTFRENQYRVHIGERQTLRVGRQTIKVRSLQVTPDSTSWQNVKTGRFETVATDQIQEIRFSTHGGLGGLGFGVLAGAVVGYLIDYHYGGLEGCVLGTLGGSAFGVLGFIVGAAEGHKEIYRFPAPSSTPQIVSDNGEQRQK